MSLPTNQQDLNQSINAAWTRLVSDAAEAYDYFTDDELELAAAEAHMREAHEHTSSPLDQELFMEQRNIEIAEELGIAETEHSLKQ